MSPGWNSFLFESNSGAVILERRALPLLLGSGGVSSSRMGVVDRVLLSGAAEMMPREKNCLPLHKDKAEVVQREDMAVWLLGLCCLFSFV